jgi:hypothetical protein
MDISIDPVEPYLADYASNIGKRPSSFFCPILLEESPGIDLIDGHILPQSLRTASRATVLQRKDVDNFFGHKVESALVEFLNSVTYTKAEFLERAKGVAIVSKNAGPLDLFIPSSKSTPPFPKLGLKDGKGQTIASPHVKGTLDDLGGSSGSAEVRGTMSFHKSSIDAAMLKTAHLALFRLAGYQWALSSAGQFASQPLRTFFRSAGQTSDLGATFAEFANAFHVVLTPTFSIDTLADSKVILHDKVSDPNAVAPFAMSCVFKVNNRILIVTLPFSIENDSFPQALDEYRLLAADWNQPHRQLVASFGRGKLDVESVVNLQYTENPPPELIPSNRSDSD